MTAIEWDKTGDRMYETGLDHGVLYPMTDDGKYGTGVPWNGLTSVSEKPSGAEASAQYADNIKYLNLVSAEDFSATIEAFTYPPEFAECDGSASPIPGVTIGQQKRKLFGLSYRTKVGSDTKGQDAGFKLHLIYNCLAAPSEKTYNTVNDSPEAMSFSWELSTTQEKVSGYNPSATLVIDSTKTDQTKLKALMDKLYGTANGEPTLPSPDEVIAMLGTTSPGTHS